MVTVERTRRRRKKIVARGSLDRRPAVHGAAKTVEYSTKQAWANRNLCVFRARIDGIAWFQSINFFERHRQDAAVAETDHLCTDDLTASRVNLTKAADLTGWSL